MLGLTSRVHTTSRRLTAAAQVHWRRTICLAALATTLILAIGAGAAWATAVSNVTVSANPATAGSRRAVDEVGFKATKAVKASTDFIRLSGPAGSQFEGSGYVYIVSDGAASEVADGEVNPEGLGQNVVNVGVPAGVSIAAGDTVHVTAYAVANPPTAEAGQFSVSTTSDVTPARKSLTIKAAAAVASATVSSSNLTAGAQGTKVTVGFKAAGPLTSASSIYYYYYAQGYVRLTGPAGTSFASSTYAVTDGSASAGASGEVNPEGLGSNVVDVFIPQSVSVAAGDAVQVVASNVSNPATAASTAKFAIATSSDVTPVEKAFGITAATAVTNLTVSVIPATAGSKRVVDEVSFKAKNGLPYDAECSGCTRFIRLQGPAGSEFEVYGYYASIVSDGSASEVSYGEVNPEGLGQNVVNVRVPAGVSIAAGDTVHVTAYGVANPPTAGAGEFSISTSGDVTPASKALTTTPAAAVTAASVATTNTSAGATGTKVTVGFKATGPLTTGTEGSCYYYYYYSCRGYVRLTAPAGASFSANSFTVTDGSASESTSGVVDPEGLGNNVVDVPVPQSVSVAAGDAVQVVASNVSNPATAASTAKFAIATSSDVTPVEKAFGITAATAVTNLTVSVIPATAGSKRVVDEVSFKAKNGLPYDAECSGCTRFIRLQGPAGSEFEVYGYYASIVSDGSASEVSYGEVNPEGLGQNVVNVRVPAGVSIAAGDTVHVTAYGVANPPTAGAGEFSISTSGDVTPASKALTTTPAAAVTAASVATTNTSAGATGTKVTVGFKATGPLTTGTEGSCYYYYYYSCRGYVRLTAPAGASFSANSFTVTDGSASESTSGVVDPEGLGNNVVDVPVPREVAVAAGDKVQVVAQNVSNPAAAESSAKFGIATSSDVATVEKAFAIGALSSVTSLTVRSIPATAGSKRVVDEVSFNATNGLSYDTECSGCTRFIRLKGPVGSEFVGSDNAYVVTDGLTSETTYGETNPEGLGNNVVNVRVPLAVSIAAGDTVHVAAYGAANPPAAGAGEFSVSTSGDVTPASKSLTTTPAAAVTAASVATTNTAAGATGTKVTVGFKATGPLTSANETSCYYYYYDCAGYVRLTAPGDASFSSSSYTITDGSASQGASGVVDPEGLGNNVVDVLIPQEVPVAAGDTVALVAENMTNPTTSASSAKFAISTSSDVTQIEKAFPITSASIPVAVSPPSIGGTAQKGQTLVRSDGSWSNGPTRYAYQWLRCEGSTCNAISGATDQSYLLSAADVGKSIEVQEVASNAAGSSSPSVSAATAVVVVAPLHASAGEDLASTQGVAVSLDGSGSTPSESITSYQWEFGDGSSGSGAIVNHTYSSAGTYTAKLTVSDGQTSASDSAIVTVSATPAQQAEITVVDGASQAIEGAEVMFISPGGQKTAAVSALGGKALLANLPDGTDTVYVYKEGFQPAVGHVAVSGGVGHATVALASGALATSTLKSKEMTLAEIEAAGIDTSDPANQNVYEFEVKLAFFDEPVLLGCHINSAGEFVAGCGFGPGGGGGGGYVGGGGGGGGGGVGTCTPHECEYGLPGGGEVVVSPHMVEGKPLISWLILRGSVTVLKQFTTVSMAIQNLSDEPFKLTHGSSTLTLPAGLSLAPIATPQSLTQPVADVPGKGSVSTTWVVRGDAPGSYYMSADYKGQLEPFESAVDIPASLAEPFNVYGKEKLKLSVKADSGTLVAGRPYHVTIGLTNEAPVPFYNVNLAIDPKVHANFVFQPQEYFSDIVTELAPGQTLYSHAYILLPDSASVGKFNTNLSSATFDGEEAHPGENIEEVAPPPLYELSAPNDTPNRVHLHWQAVPGAEGYEVFSTTNLDTAFAEAPDPASATAAGTLSTAPLSSSATDAYLAGTSGVTRFYAVSALVEGHPTVESQAVEASAGGSTAPEFGRCVKVPAEKEAGKTVYHGWFTAATCLVRSATRTSKYEWVSGAIQAGFHTKIKELTKVTLETVKKVKVICTGESSAGAITSAKTVGNVIIKFTGCESATKKCTTPGLAPGELETKKLEGVLGIESITIKEGKETRHVGLDLYPVGKTGPFMEYTCTGSAPTTLTGSIIGPAPADKMFTTATVKHAATAGKQKPERFEGGEKDVLTNALNEQVGLTDTTTQTNEEAFEINAFF
jgi:hypothetical protein